MSLDVGFKVFRAAPSNFQEGALKKEWKPENVITEMMLKLGMPLCSGIKELENLRNRVFQITSEHCELSLFICLDEKIENETVEKLILQNNDNGVFIFLKKAVGDSAFAGMSGSKCGFILI